MLSTEEPVMVSVSVWEQSSVSESWSSAQWSRPELSTRDLFPALLFSYERVIPAMAGMTVRGFYPGTPDVENFLFHILILYVTISREERHFRPHTKERRMIPLFKIFDGRGYTHQNRLCPYGHEQSAGNLLKNRREGLDL